MEKEVKALARWSLHDSKKILLNGKIIKYQKLKLNNIGMLCLVSEFKFTFSHFKQDYTLFHTYVFLKTPNNNSQTILPKFTPFKIH